MKTKEQLEQRIVDMTEHDIETVDAMIRGINMEVAIDTRDQLARINRNLERIAARIGAPKG